MEYIGGKEMKRESYPKLYEYRIKYNATADTIANNSYHYFMSKNAEEAFEAHSTMLEKKGLITQDISIEKFNPYSNKWEDETFFNAESDQRTG